MATCNPTIEPFTLLDGALDVSAKYTELMLASMSEDSLYERTKLTMLEIFDNLDIDAETKGSMAITAISTLATQTAVGAMQTAMMWSKEERDGGYALSKAKADAELVLATKEKTLKEICLVEKQIDLMCAQITATTAGSTRENGHVTLYGDDGCSAKELDNTGLKYYQTKQVEAATYQINADAYRKSGVVVIGTDPADGVEKGISGNEYGYTQAQIDFSDRQRYAFEDSKSSQAVNGSSSMIGQMLSAEIAPSQEDVARWRDAMDKLLTPHSTTSQP